MAENRMLPEALAPQEDRSSKEERAVLPVSGDCSPSSCCSSNNSGGSTRASSGQQRATNIGSSGSISSNSSSTSICSSGCDHDDKGDPVAEIRQFSADYALHDVLGTGSQATVRRAFSLKSGKVVAVKSCVKSEETLKDWESLKDEGEIHLALDHPHIVSFEEMYASEESLHMVMECLEGGELFERIAQGGAMKEEVAARLTLQLLRSLAHLHSRRIVHRDLKPENVVFDRRGSHTAKLIDFGFATHLPKGEVLTKPCGTLGYSAPEVFSSEGYSEKADMFSLGAVVYFMVCGRMPYSGPRREVLRKSKLGHIDFCRNFAKLSQSARLFLYALLNRDGTKRLSVCEALAHPWLEKYAKSDIEAARSEAIAEYEAQGEAPSPLLEKQLMHAPSEKQEEAVSCFTALCIWFNKEEKCKALGAAPSPSIEQHSLESKHLLGLGCLLPFCDQSEVSVGIAGEAGCFMFSSSGRKSV